MLETKVAGLESQVEELQRQLNDVMDIMARHETQVLPSEDASSVMLPSQAPSSEFEVLATRGEQQPVPRGSEDSHHGRAGQPASARQ